MPITFEHGEVLNTIRLEGEIDISCAAELKRILSEALSAKSAINVSLKDASLLDVTAVQLLWAAKRDARELGIGFCAAGSLPDEAIAALSIAGLEEFVAFESCPDGSEVDRC